MKVSECWSLENSANCSFSTEGIVEELFFALNDIELCAWFFKLVDMGIFEFFDKYWSFRKSIAVVILFTVRDGIDTLFWNVLLFLFELNWVVLSNNSIFCSEDIFPFPILFFELVFSCRSGSRPEFQSLCVCRTVVFIEVTLFFHI